VLQDLRAAWRAALRSPIFTATAALTLAIGIGASTAMFSIVNAVLLRPLPFRDPDRLVEIFEANPAEGRDETGVSAANFLDWRERSKAFQDVALLMADATPSVLDIGNFPIQARMAFVSTNLMSVLGVSPASGRGFSSSEASEIILSHELWRRAFGGDPAVIGRGVRVEGAPGTVIIGVMPPGFAFRAGVEFWMPLDDHEMKDRRSRYSQAFARLRSPVTVDAARLEMTAIAADLAREYPATNTGWTVRVEPLHEPAIERHRLGLLTLFAATAFVMLVGCANVSNLLLARGVSRQAELAVRTALGASRRRIMQLLLTESLALAAAGCVGGLLLAHALMPMFVHLASRSVPGIAEVGLSVSVLLFAGAASVIAALTAGLVPAARLSRTDLQLILKAAGERTTHQGGHTYLQRLIVAGELALCLALVVGAMLFIRTFVGLRTLELGFNPAYVISIDARFPMYRTMVRNRWQLLATDTSSVLQRLRSTAGIDAVAAINHAPLSGTLVPVTVTLPGEQQNRRALYRNVTPDYFRTLGIQFVAGRDFTEGDISHLARSPIPDARVREEGAVIVNESAARLFWPNRTALGQLLSTEYDPGISGRRVVGIVRDSRSSGLRDEIPIEVYVPYLQDPSFAMTLLVRTRMPLEQIAATLRHEIHQAAPDLSTANLRMLDDIVIESMGSTPFTALIATAFAAVALALSAVGIFSVFAFGVAARTREIGIRLALGASRAVVTRMFLREALATIGVGVIAGSAIVLALGRIIAALLFAVSPADPISFGVAVGVVVLVALAASYLPVRHAMRIDPAVTLRG
jgi:putative ABC transport system permease protein